MDTDYQRPRPAICRRIQIETDLTILHALVRMRLMDWITHSSPPYNVTSLTTFCSRPWVKARTFSTAVPISRRRAEAVAQAMCGVI